jgi:putative oxidoreductase
MNKQLINTLLSSNASVSMLILRIALGIIFIAHGAQKLFGWFGGYGLEGTGKWMASIGFEPGYVMALLAGSGEFFGGLAILLGFLTRPAALVTAFTMLVASTLHIGNGLFLSNNGFEFALILIAASLTLVFQGGGKYAVDNILLKTIHKGVR